jgi:hypothetical protein
MEGGKCNKSLVGSPGAPDAQGILRGRHVQPAFPSCRKPGTDPGSFSHLSYQGAPPHVATKRVFGVRQPFSFTWKSNTTTLPGGGWQALAISGRGFPQLPISLRSIHAADALRRGPAPFAVANRRRRPFQCLPGRSPSRAGRGGQHALAGHRRLSGCCSGKPRQAPGKSPLAQAPPCEVTVGAPRRPGAFLGSTWRPAGRHGPGLGSIALLLPL